jgi:hypothetical protein
MINEIQQKVWNINIVVEELKLFPHTYGTILQNEFENCTYQIILRRKLNALCKDGIILKAVIPGTRFSRLIFYIMPKKYYILVENTRFGSDVYVFYEYNEISDNHIEVDKCWKLDKNKWEEINGKRIFYEGHILKWI